MFDIHVYINIFLNKGKNRCAILFDSGFHLNFFLSFFFSIKKVCVEEGFIEI